MRAETGFDPEQLEKIKRMAAPAAARATEARQMKKGENIEIRAESRRQRDFRKSSPYSSSDVRIANQAKYRRTVH
ncbi:MAG: hypothetical protein WCV50_06520 [Patescibacteria group bacterium]|jgi:hypothetical protein